jgi:hypothetical protein
MVAFFNNVSLWSPFQLDPEKFDLYTKILLYYVTFFLEHKEHPMAFSYLNIANLLNPEDSNIVSGFCSFYETVGKFKTAEYYFKKP